MSEQQGFDSWAIVELFGHQKIAGRVSEQPMAGTTFLRVEVPETNRSAAYTRLFGAGAIYGITPCTEEEATSILNRGWGFSHPEFATKALPAPVRTGGPDLDDHDEDDEDDEDDERRRY